VQNLIYSENFLILLVYEVLNDDVWSNINNTVTEYMKNITKTIFQNSKRQQRSLQNRTEASKGKFK